jgi:putative nucleotidyltransferase with HDIG domain
LAAGLKRLMTGSALTAGRLLDAISAAPPLEAAVLRIGRCGYFDLDPLPETAEEAVERMGLRRCLSILTTAAMYPLFAKPVSGYSKIIPDIWGHSVSVAIAAEGLAAEIGAAAGPDLFAAAVLHDIGMLILGDFVEEYQETIDEIIGRGLSLAEAEQMVLGVDHGTVGAKILKHWSFPNRMIDAAGRHHEPDTLDPADSLVDLVHLANVLCFTTGIAAASDGVQEEPSPAAAGRLMVKPPMLERVAGRTLLWAKPLSKVLPVRERA